MTPTGEGMEENLTPREQTLNDSDQTDAPEQLGVIQFPEGFPGADWLIRKTKHLNNAHKEWFSTILLDIEDNYKLYELKQVAGTMPNGTTIPITTSIVDTMTSRAVSSLVPRETFVNAIALDPETNLEGDYDKQTMLSDFINESIGNSVELADKADEAVKMLWLENVTCLEAKWSIETKTDKQVMRAPDPMMQGPGPIVAEEVTQYECGHPDFEPVSIRMCAWDPRCKNEFAKSPWFRIRSMKSINELFQMQQEGIIQDVDAVVKKSNKAMTPENPTDPDAKQSQSVEGRQLPSVGWDDGVWEVDRWWSTIAWKNPEGVWMEGKYEFWIVGGDTVVKFRDNVLVPQRIPIVTVKSSRRPGQLMSQGPVTVIKQMQKDLNSNMANLGQLMKNASYSPTFYTPSSGIDGRRVSLQSNSLIPALDVNGIKRFEPATQAIELINRYIEFIINEMRQATAANDQAQGIEAGGTDTATEAQILAQGSNNRFAYIIEMINAAMFGGLAQEYFWLWKQFGEPGKMVVKDGSNDGKGYAVQPEDLQGNYIFKPVPTQSQQAKLQHFSQLKSLVTDLMQLQMQAPQMLVGPNGQPKQLDLYDFLVNQMLPLVNVQARGLFKDAPMPMMGLPGLPSPGAGAPPPGPDGLAPDAQGPPPEMPLPTMA